MGVLDKRFKDPIVPVMASSAYPIVDYPIEIEGQLCLDGVIAKPLPAREIIERFNVTDLLIILNVPLTKLDEATTYVETWGARLMLARYSKDLAEAYLGRKEEYNKNLLWAIEKQNIGLNAQSCVGFIAPEYTVSYSCRNVETLTNFWLHGFRQTLKFFNLHFV